MGAPGPFISPVILKPEAKRLLQRAIDRVQQRDAKKVALRGGAVSPSKPYQFTDLQKEH